jgi:solute carrier family 25 protein 44
LAAEQRVIMNDDDRTTAASAAARTKPIIYDIEWYMLDKSKYYPYTILSSLTVRTILYPLALVRTRLQIQVKNTHYRGTWDALKTVYKLEGFRALYRSFMIFNFHLIPSFIYITTFENIRHKLSAYEKFSNTYVRAMIAGGTSSLLSQALSVPIDVVVQHMMLVGQKSSATAGGVSKDKCLDRIRVSKEAERSTYRIFKEICTQIYRNDGIRGFYRSYFLSTGLMSMNSALWWPIYYFYQGKRNQFPLSGKCLQLMVK